MSDVTNYFEFKNFMDLKEKELQFIKKSWYFSYKKEWECRWMLKSVYKKFFDKIINKILMKDDLKFILYFSSEDGLIGWSADNRKDLIYYAYLSSKYRESKNGSYHDIKTMLSNLKKNENGNVDCCFLSYFILKLLDKKVNQNQFRRFE